MCHLTLPSDMYIHLHTIGLTGVTEVGTVTVHFGPNRRRFHWSISRWLLLLRKNIFGKSFQSSSSLFVPSCRFFFTFSKHAMIISEGIFPGNGSLTSYTYEIFQKIMPQLTNADTVFGRSHVCIIIRKKNWNSVVSDLNTTLWKMGILSQTL